MIVRSGFSFKHAFGKLPDVIARLKELGADTLALADIDSTHSFVRVTKLAQEAELRLVYGAELKVSCEHNGSKINDRWIFLAKQSLYNLHELVYISTKERLSYSGAIDFNDVIKIAGPSVCIDELEKYQNEDLYIGLSPEFPRAHARRLMEAGFEPITVARNKYPIKEDFEIYRVLLGSSKAGRGFASSQTYPQHILSDDEWCQELSYLGDEVLGRALNNRNNVLKQCNAKIQKAKLIVPDKPKSLREMCYEGARRLNIDLGDNSSNNHSNVYHQRLNRELDIIKEKNFEDYFYVVADMMQYARTQMVVGPARGSSGGSLVCYFLGITAIDPIKFDLVFERFIDLTRSDLPDIDVDLSQENRPKVFEYMENKYGRERVARLGSVNTYKAKGVLNQIGSAFKIAPWHVNDFAAAVIKRPDADPRVGCTIQDTFEETIAGQQFLQNCPEAIMATRMEEHPASAGKHAAGVILTDQPVLNFVALNGSNRTSMCDKKDAEKLDILKIDALGLSQLTVFERCLELIGKPDQNNKFIDRIPIDEPEALEILNSMKYSGVFQYNHGTAVTAYVQKLRELGGRIEGVEDICALTALVRPGPLGSGATESWVARRAGIERISYQHDSLEPILNKTLGVITYQEQILRMGREVAGLSWEDVTGIRKAIAKKMGSVFLEYGEKWREGAHKVSGMSYELADKIWEELKEHGSYSFNRSHAMAYALISYYCCWLKAHYPLEFAAATLDSHKEPHALIDILRELRNEGVNYIAVDPHRSIDKWTIVVENGSRVLLGPITMIEGCGPKALIEVDRARKKGVPVKDTIAKKMAPPKTKIDSLEPVRDAFVKRKEKYNIVTKPIDVDSIEMGDQGICVYVLVDKVKQIDENDKDKIQKRGYEINGPSAAVQGWIRDDTGKIFFKIDAKNQLMVKDFLEKARPGKSLFAIKGFCPPSFRMLKVTGFKYAGDIDGKGEQKDVTLATSKDSPALKELSITYGRQEHASRMER